MHGLIAAQFEETERGRAYRLVYESSYQGPPISLTLPVRAEPYTFDRFPPFFDGLLPEGDQLEALLRQAKIDRDDPFLQLLTVGLDMVGAVTIEGAP